MIAQKEITIITPTYNSIRTLNEYMKAIIKQDYPHNNISVIFVDGGSNDGTLECIKKYSDEVDFSIEVYKNSLKMYKEKFNHLIMMVYLLIHFFLLFATFHNFLDRTFSFLKTSLFLKLLKLDFFAGNLSLERNPH